MKISINCLVGLGTNFQQTMFYKQLGTFHLILLTSSVGGGGGGVDIKWNGP